MALITHAYFDEGDFSKVSILQDTYHHLNAVLSQSETRQQTFVGMKCSVEALGSLQNNVLPYIVLTKSDLFYEPILHSGLSLFERIKIMILIGKHIGIGMSDN